MNICNLLLWAICLGWTAAVKFPDTLTLEELKILEEDPKPTHRVGFAVLKNKAYAGVLVFGLFGDVAPKTTQNFLDLANMTYGYGYNMVPFHRIIKDFMIQGGDFERKDGTGGHSIYGKHFPDESFQIHHNKKGRLLMANLGKDTNGAQFFVTTKDDCLWLDGKHVVFGQLLEGFEFLEIMNKALTNLEDKPVDDWVIYASESVEIDWKSQKTMEELTAAKELELAGLRGETTLINEQVHVLQPPSPDFMSTYIIVGGICFSALVLLVRSRRKRRSIGLRF